MTESPPKKRFVFEVFVDDIPHSEDTVEYAFGEGASYNDVYPINTHANDLIYKVFQDAVKSYYVGILRWEADKAKAPETSDSGERTKESCQHMIDWYEEKIKAANAIMESIKFVRMEDIPENNVDKVQNSDINDS